MLELNTTCGTLQDGLKIVFADIRGISRLEGWATAAHGRNESCSSVYVMYLNFNGHIELWPISPNRGTLIIEMLVVQERIN